MKTLDQHNYNGIDATIIADSKNQFGNRIISYVITFPRIVLAEFNTHRMLSRNSASSRAIPFNKMVEKVTTNPFIPIAFQKNHSGMQGSEYLKGRDHDLAKGEWLRARSRVIENATLLNLNNNVTKQICNRLLEPWMWHTAIVTATEWENFFALRAHPDAEIHIAKLAEVMLEQANLSTPKELKGGEWHIPFGDNIDINRKFFDETQFVTTKGNSIEEHVIQLKIRIAIARCARVSYLNFEGKDNYQADIELHDRLLKAGHMSPFEHCAKTMTWDEREQYVSGKGGEIEDWRIDEEGNETSYMRYELDDDSKGWSGNFKGFIQYRKMIPGENKKDERFLQK